MDDKLPVTNTCCLDSLLTLLFSLQHGEVMHQPLPSQEMVATLMKSTFYGFSLGKIDDDINLWSGMNKFTDHKVVGTSKPAGWVHPLSFDAMWIFKCQVRCRAGSLCPGAGKMRIHREPRLGLDWNAAGGWPAQACQKRVDDQIGFSMCGLNGCTEAVNWTNIRVERWPTIAANGNSHSQPALFPDCIHDSTWMFTHTPCYTNFD